MKKERILLIEDSKALSNVLTKKMLNELEFEVLQAYSLKQVEDIIEEDDDFFVALCDLNLPDAPNGEVVDLVISKGIAVIVLSGSEDKKLQEEILKKNIIDYVYKGNMEDINYIFSIIQRLDKNRDIKVLIVDDSIVARNELKRLLETRMFKVLVAAHGEEALNYMNDNEDIKIIFTDYNMPVINGLELVEEVKRVQRRDDIIIFALSASNEPRIASRFFRAGADEFMKKPYEKEELFLRLNNVLDMKRDLHELAKEIKDILKREKQ